MDLQFDESDFLDILTALHKYDIDCQRLNKGEQLLEKEDLIAQLRPRKVHHILALNSCKTAYFIGQVMSHRAMRELVDWMRPLRRPWICAHGRPTIRYLLNFDQFRIEYELPSRLTRCQTDLERDKDGVPLGSARYCALSRSLRHRPPQLIRQDEWLKCQYAY